MDYLILDDKGVIAMYPDEDEARTSFDSAPNADVPDWNGDLILARRLAVRR